LLVLDQANVAWLTSGGVARSIVDPDEMPALYFSPGQRWLISSNVESQRMFDEELDGLGFLLKEWPWHWGRKQLLLDLCSGRRVMADEPFSDTRTMGDELRPLRRILTRYEQACMRLVGQVVANALEATCRNIDPGETERDIAGQLCHRLYRRGATPAVISVAADGRSRTYRRHGFTSAPVKHYGVLTATARKYGLYATASRAFSFGPADEAFKKEHVTACKVAATYMASTWPDASPREIFNAGKRVFLLTGHEHEWQMSAQGFVTGRMPVERNLVPEMDELFAGDTAVTWCPTVGAASCCDTFLVGEKGPSRVTVMEQWPMVGLRVSGMEITCPHILERTVPATS
jgi:Xaa-Pro aminopeptidase